MRQLTLIPVSPIGKHEGLAFVDGPGLHGVRPVMIDDYPEPDLYANLLRETRGILHITLRNAAEAAGLTATQLSGLETGRIAMSPDDWVALIKCVSDIRK